MSDERLARQCCDLLGWTWGVANPPPYPGAAVGPWDDGSLTFGMRVPGRPGVWLLDIDLPTLATATLVRHAGPVDAGPCPECDGGCRVASAQAEDCRPKHAKPSSWEDAGPIREVPIHMAPRPVSVYASVWVQNCPACVVDGKPTGRRVVSAPEAVLLAAPRECPDCEGRSAANWDDCETCEGRGRIPGHEGAREALRLLADEWREHLPVLGDYIEARGILTAKQKSSLDQWSRWQDAPSVARWLDERRDTSPIIVNAPDTIPSSLAECPAVARWLLSWLSGEITLDRCELGVGCDESGSCFADYHGKPEQCGRRALAIGPHLPTIYTHLATVWERETIPCECQEPGWGIMNTEHPICAGLGRVMPDQKLMTGIEPATA